MPCGRKGSQNISTVPTVMLAVMTKDLKFIGESGVDAGEVYIGDPRIFDRDGYARIENGDNNNGIITVKNEKGVVCGVSVQATGGDGSCPIYFATEAGTNKCRGIIVSTCVDYNPCDPSDLEEEYEEKKTKRIEPMTVQINSDCLWIGDPCYLVDGAQAGTIFSEEEDTWADHLSALAEGKEIEEPTAKCYNYAAGHQGLGTLIRLLGSTTIIIKIFFGQDNLVNHLEFYVDK